MLLEIALTLFWVFVAMLMIVGILMLTFSLFLLVAFLWFLWKEGRGSESDS